MNLFTKSGKPLQVSNKIVYSSGGTVVGRIEGDKVFGENGHYVASIVDERLVYRGSQKAALSSPFNAPNIAATKAANVVESSIYGDEPDIPD